MEMHVNPKKQFTGSQTEALWSLPGAWCPIGLQQQLFGTCTKIISYNVPLKIQDASD